jgi:DNA-binding response OmpR family regulator
MARVLLIHHDKAAREVLKLSAIGHDVDIAKDVGSALRKFPQTPPDVILVSQDHRQEHAVQLLKWMRDHTMDTPVVAVLGRTGAAHKPAVLKLGAAATLDFPIDRTRLNAAIEAALTSARQAAEGPPPVAEEELRSNLSVLENTLNRQMLCVAGKNQVFIQSTLMGTATTRPRICLRCSLRAEYGLPREVYYEYIRDVCCIAPIQCEAARRFGAARESA